MKPIEYKGFLINWFSSEQSRSRAGELYIEYPDGKISPICSGSLKAAKRIIDTYHREDNTIFWNALETVFVHNKPKEYESKVLQHRRKEIPA